MANEPKGSFVRWQAVTIDQLTYAINLILGFAVAVLGFQVAQLQGEKFVLVGWQKCIFAISLFSLVVSVFFGILVVINRLRSFRATMRAARAREEEQSEATNEGYRQLYRCLDARTWWMFWWQIGTFAAGIVFSVLSLIAVAGHKLL